MRASLNDKVPTTALVVVDRPNDQPTRYGYPPLRVTHPMPNDIAVAHYMVFHAQTLQHVEICPN